MAALLLNLASTIAALSAAICWVMSTMVKLPPVISTRQLEAAEKGMALREMNTAVRALTKAMHEQAAKATCGAGFAAAAAFAQALRWMTG